MKTTISVLVMILGIILFWIGTNQLSSMIEFIGGILVIGGLISAYHTGKDHKVSKWFRWL